MREARRTDDVILRWPTAAARTWLRGFVRDVATDDNVLAVIAAGSAVRHGVESEDLDLVVLCGKRNRFRYKPPIEVDLRSFNVAATEDALSAGDPLLGWAVKFGKAIFDRDRAWERLVLAWRDRVPLPDPALARERAQKVLRHLAAVREMGDCTAAAELNLSYLTFLARAELSERGVYPASRPELPGQLRAIGEVQLARQVEKALQERRGGWVGVASHRPGE